MGGGGVGRLAVGDEVDVRDGLGLLLSRAVVRIDGGWILRVYLKGHEN